MRVLSCRKVPAAGGAELAADVYLPDGPGPFPALLVRTPYHRTGRQSAGADFAARGYAYVVQDVRGKYDSGGVFEPLVQEAADGQAAIDWVANQCWCNGRLGLLGLSYLGIVQVPAAAGGHEALRCIIPGVAPGSFFRDWVRYDGCFALGNLIRWSLTHATCRTQPPLEHFTWDELNALPSLEAVFARAGIESPFLRDCVAHDRYDEYWQGVDQDLMHAKIRVPGLHVGGWFDHISRGQFNAYRNIRDNGATGLARSSQRLVIGPWGHRNVMGSGEDHRRYGDWDFGAEADYSVAELQFQCLDHYLRDNDNGFGDQPAVRLFVMGENRWAEFSDWPPTEAEIQPWYLDIDNGLSRETPGTEADDVFSYDPADPVPICGGQIYWGNEVVGPVDQRAIIARPDVLYYHGPPLDADLRVIGEIRLELELVSNAEDTDIIAKFCVEE